MALVELDVAFGSVNADSNHLALLAMDPAGAQVADLPGLQAADAGVADAHAAAEGELAARRLTGLEDGRAAVGLCLEVLDPEVDRAAAADLGGRIAADDRLEALDAQQVGVPLLLPVRGEVVE